MPLHPMPSRKERIKKKERGNVMEDKQSVLLRTAPASASAVRAEAPPAAGREAEARRRVSAQQPQVEKPIFIVGVGRSGSTIFHKMFSEHPNVVWVSGLCDRYPSRPAVSRALQRMIDWPLVNRPLKRRYEPGECYRFWNHHCRGFSQPCRDLLASDVTELNRKQIPPAMAELFTRRRQRLLHKITGWPRIGFLREL